MKSENIQFRLISLPVIVIALTGLILANCGSSGTKESQTQKTEQKTEQKSDSVYYTCTMHPEVHSAKPGDCPVCGMKMVRSDEIKK